MSLDFDKWSLDKLLYILFEACTLIVSLVCISLPVRMNPRNHLVHL